MFIILSIYSKNANSLSNFLKFFYRLKQNKILKLKFYAVQSQKKKKFSFFSVLRSPHVNKKSQEQFEYYLHIKQFKIHVSQVEKFLFFWKWIKTKLFFDVEIKIYSLLNDKSFNGMILEKSDCDKFKPIFFRKKTFLKKNKKENLCLSTITKQTFLKLMDIQGEKLLKSKI